jgi:hypothetical protein
LRERVSGPAEQALARACRPATQAKRRGDVTRLGFAETDPLGRGRVARLTLDPCSDKDYDTGNGGNHLSID